MNKPQLHGLLLSILMVIAPHAEHLPLWITALVAALLVWRGYLTQSDGKLPPRWLLMTITFASSAGILVEYHTLLGREAGVALLILLTALKFMELRSARDAMVLIFLGCFIVITNFFYSQSIPVALYMLATLMVIVTAWVHLQATTAGLKPRLKIAGTLLLQAIPLTLVLFVLFPRVQGPLWGMPNDAYARTGLDDSMSPGSMSRLIQSDEVAFRVVYRDQPPRRDQMYWRGPVLWQFDGSTWTPGRPARAIAPQLAELAQPIEYGVTLEPHDKRWLFALDLPERLSVDARTTDDFQLLRQMPVRERLRYEARSMLVYRANPEESSHQLKRALQLPPVANPKARELAARWRADYADDGAVVRAALAHFNREGYAYTLEPPKMTGANNIDEFLFEAKRGFCEHYAGSFVFLMRAAGIPARVVTGYQGGEYNNVGGYYIVRQSDAHAWAEVWLAGQGWVRIDPTAAIAPDRVERNVAAAVSNNAALPFMARSAPQWLRDLRLNWDALANRWNQWVLGYDTEMQFALLSRLGMEDISWQKLAANMVAGLSLVVGILAFFMLRRLLPKRADPVQAAWLQACKRLEKAGLPRAPHEGPLDYAERIAAARPDLADTIRELAADYAALRYAGTQDGTRLRAFQRRAATFRVRRSARRGIIRAG